MTFARYDAGSGCQTISPKREDTIEAEELGGVKDTIPRLLKTEGDRLIGEVTWSLGPGP